MLKTSVDGRYESKLLRRLNSRRSQSKAKKGVREDMETEEMNPGKEEFLLEVWDSAQRTFSRHFHRLGPAT